LASSFSRKGIMAVAMEIIMRGDTSISNALPVHVVDLIPGGGR
jgi:hypothetical protein